jgi:molecular chaperone HtpG
MKMQQMMKMMGQTQMPAMKPTLEINPDHEIVKKLLASSDEALLDDASWLLLEQALLIEGVPVKNPSVFVQRLNRVLSRAV